MKLDLRTCRDLRLELRRRRDHDRPSLILDETPVVRPQIRHLTLGASLPRPQAPNLVRHQISGKLTGANNPFEWTQRPGLLLSALLSIGVDHSPLISVQGRPLSLAA